MQQPLLFLFGIIGTYYYPCSLPRTAIAHAIAGGNSNFQVETDTFVVRVTGNENVPKYDFWLKANPNDKYFVKFDRMYECSCKCLVKHGMYADWYSQRKWMR